MMTSVAQSCDTSLAKLVLPFAAELDLNSSIAHLSVLMDAEENSLHQRASDSMLRR
jgi:hypothetical protein